MTAAIHWRADQEQFFWKGRFSSTHNPTEKTKAAHPEKHIGSSGDTKQIMYHLIQNLDIKKLIGEPTDWLILNNENRDDVNAWIRQSIFVEQSWNDTVRTLAERPSDSIG